MNENGSMGVSGSAKSQLSVVLAQVNPTVGNLKANAQLIRDSVNSAAQEGPIDLILFGEMVLNGYPIEDLALREDFQTASMHSIRIFQLLGSPQLRVFRHSRRWQGRWQGSGWSA